MKYKLDLIHISMMHYSTDCLDGVQYLGLAQRIKDKFKSIEVKNYDGVTAQNIPICEMDLEPNEVEAIYRAACIKMGVVQKRSKHEHADIMKGTEKNMMYLCMELSRIRRSIYKFNFGHMDNNRLN